MHFKYRVLSVCQVFIILNCLYLWKCKFKILSRLWYPKLKFHHYRQKRDIINKIYLQIGFLLTCTDIKYFKASCVFQWVRLRNENFKKLHLTWFLFRYLHFQITWDSNAVDLRFSVLMMQMKLCILLVWYTYLNFTTTDMNLMFINSYYR